MSVETHDDDGIEKFLAFHEIMDAEKARMKAEHDAQVDFIDLSETVKEAGSLIISTSQFENNPPRNQFAYVNQTAQVRVVDLEKMSDEELDRGDHIYQEEVEKAVLRNDRLAVQPKGDNIVWIDSLDKDPNVAIPGELNPESCFDIDSSGELLYVSSTGQLVRKDHSLDVNRIKKRRFFRNDILSPISKFRIRDDYLLVEDQPTTGLHHPEYMPGVTWIGPMGPPPNYDKEWAQVHRRLYNLSDPVTPLLNTYANILASEVNELEKAFPNRVFMNSNGIASIEARSRIEPDMWYSGPLYDRVRFFNEEGAFLGGKKISSKRFAGEKVATEANIDGRWGFVGSAGGQIEIVDLHREESLKLHREERREISYGRNNKGEATSVRFSIEAVDNDHYPHRRPPSYIATWKAHEQGINNLLIVSETEKVIELASFAIDNTIKKWHLEKSALDKAINKS